MLAVTPSPAQQAPGANGNGANGKAGGNAPGAPVDARAAARATNDRLRGVSREDALLGGPGAYGDPYRSAMDANETRQSDLMRAERVPNPAMRGNGYDPSAPAGGQALARPKGLAADGAGGAAPAQEAGPPVNAPPGAGLPAPGNAAPPSTPEQAAQSLYRDPFNGPKGATQQLYRSPW
jgi:hypothetical protein